MCETQRMRRVLAKNNMREDEYMTLHEFTFALLFFLVSYYIAGDEPGKKNNLKYKWSALN